MTVYWLHQWQYVPLFLLWQKIIFPAIYSFTNDHKYIHATPYTLASAIILLQTMNSTNWKSQLFLTISCRCSSKWLLFTPVSSWRNPKDRFMHSIASHRPLHLLSLSTHYKSVFAKIYLHCHTCHPVTNTKWRVTAEGAAREIA